MFKARSLWQWSNYLHRQVEAERLVLRINFDESNVRLHQESMRGNRTQRARRLKRKALALTPTYPAHTRELQ